MKVASLVGITGVVGHLDVAKRSHIGGARPFEIVADGWPEAAVKEATIRVRSAMEHSGFAVPGGIAVHTDAPAGTPLDAAIALRLAAISNGRDVDVASYASIVGELSLSGDLRPVRGVLPIVHALSRDGVVRVILPRACAAEAAKIPAAWGVEVALAATLTEAWDLAARHAEDGLLNEGFGRDRFTAPPSNATSIADTAGDLDMSEVRGHAAAVRALEVAAAGGLSVLFVAHSGAAPVWLARRAVTIMAELTGDESEELALIASAAGLGQTGSRPFRAPHHTASMVALIGGGPRLRPGEITLAHGGVLFLQDADEFRRDAISAVFAAKRDGVALRTSGKRSIEMPARPWIIGSASAWHCKCLGACVCNPVAKESHARRLRELASRFDMVVTLAALAPHENASGPMITSAEIRARVTAARSGGAAVPSCVWCGGAQRLRERSYAAAAVAAVAVEALCVRVARRVHVLSSGPIAATDAEVVKVALDEIARARQVNADEPSGMTDDGSLATAAAQPATTALTPSEIRRLQRTRTSLPGDQRDAVTYANDCAFSRPNSDEPAAVAQWAERWSSHFASYDRSKNGPAA